MNKRVKPSPPPRYDEVFHEGTRQLDALAAGDHSSTDIMSREKIAIIQEEAEGCENLQPHDTRELIRSHEALRKERDMLRESAKSSVTAVMQALRRGCHKGGYCAAITGPGGRNE